MSEMQRNPEVPASTWMRPYSSLQQCERNAEVPLQCQKRSDFPEEARAGGEVDTQLEWNPRLTTTTPSKPRIVPCTLEEALFC